MIYRDLQIDCSRKNHIYATVNQREHGETIFRFNCLSGGVPIDLSKTINATFYGIKSDMHSVGIKCSIENNLIILPLHLQMTTSPGELHGTIELMFSNGNVRFNDICFNIVRSQDDTVIESTDLFNNLENYIAKPSISGTAGQVLSLSEDGKPLWKTIQSESGGSIEWANKSITTNEEVSSIFLETGDFEECHVSVKTGTTDVSFITGVRINKGNYRQFAIPSVKLTARDGLYFIIKKIHTDPNVSNNDTYICIRPAIVPYVYNQYYQTTYDKIGVNISANDKKVFPIGTIFGIYYK